MCGVPYHAAEGYLSRLIQKGYRVAICEQMEEAGPARSWSGARSRAWSRPAPRPNRRCCARTRITISPRSAATARAPDWLMWTSPPASFASPNSMLPKCAAMLENLNAREVLVAGAAPARCPGSAPNLEDWIFSFDYADRTLRDHFRLLTLDGCGLAGKPLAVSAAGAILHYLRDTQKSALDHLGAARLLRPRRIDDSGCGHGAQSRTAGAAVRGREQGIDAGPCARSDLHGHGRTAAAAAAAAALLATARRSKRGWMRCRKCSQATIARSEIRKLLGAHSRSGTAACEADPRHGGSARAAGAGPIARSRSAS